METDISVKKRSALHGNRYSGTKREVHCMETDIPVQKEKYIAGNRIFRYRKNKYIVRKNDNL